MNVIVDLDKIRTNIRTIKKHTSKDIIACVKSNAYGLGASYIIKTLLKENVNYFFFNKLKEYLAVKELLKDKNVLIYESLTKEQINKYYTPNLILTIKNTNDATIYKNTRTCIRVHLEIDTGMNRCGIRSINECINIINYIKDSLIIDGIYTHFASGKDEYEYYINQVNKFKKYLNLYPFNIIHSASTSSLHKEIIGNMVRVGMGMYGYHTNLKLSPALSIYTHLINIINLENGDKVGYNFLYKAYGCETLGVVDMGYFEIRDINKVYYLNKPYKFIGKTCMNHSFIIIDPEINLLSRLSLLPKFGIIDADEYDYYKILTSLNHIKKNYLERDNYEIHYVFKSASKKS